jgi:hypothetical protein
MTGPGWWRRPNRHRTPARTPPAATHVRVIHPAPAPDPDVAAGDRPERRWVNDGGCPCTICTPPETP